MRTSAINLLPEIIYDLLTNEEYGVGGIVGKRGVDEDETRFTPPNIAMQWVSTGDGVIKDRVNVRQWIYEQAGYIFVRLLHQRAASFSLKPSFPLQADYRIHKKQQTLCS